MADIPETPDAITPIPEEKPKHAGGRPSLYTEDMPSRVEEYLNTCADYYDPVTHRQTVQLPKMEGLALYLNVNRDTLFEWSRVYPLFSDSLKKINAYQKERLIDKGLSGDYNPTIAKLILSSNHGMSEKTETDITSKGESISSAADVRELSEKFDEFFKKSNS